MNSIILSAVLLLSQTVTGTPLFERGTALSPLTSFDFPDPSFLQMPAGDWYAFSTTSRGVNTPAAHAPSAEGPWTLLSNDLLPVLGAWSTGAGNGVWAPDVRLIGSTYVLYYSAYDASSPNQHCVGTATSDTVLGPYTPASTPLACPISQGGAIDPSGFTDSDGTHYVVYKIDGNSIGHGGSCGNTVAPIVPTPIMLQQLAADGVTPVGAPIEILDRGDADGPLIEAPNLILKNGVYVLTFSSNCYSTTLYDVSYATATNVRGPYTKSSAPLMVTNNPYEITAPGGATMSPDGEHMVFHANCDNGRCMFERDITISGTTLSLD